MEIEDEYNADFSQNFNFEPHDKYVKASDIIKIKVGDREFEITREEYTIALDEGRTCFRINMDGSITLITPEEGRKNKERKANQVRQFKKQLSSYNKNYLKRRW